MAPNCATEGLSATANNQNQLSVLTYDIAGNVINDGNGNQPTYDAENTLATDAGVTYDYDADGVRVEKSSGTMYWPGPSGTLAETDLNGNINEEYIYFNGARIARVDRPSGTVHYYFPDHLGSASVIADHLGHIEQQQDFYPYGGIAYTSGADPNHYKFTGKERDAESGLDEFGARYYGSSIGRFMSPDPIFMTKHRIVDPQQWNMYAYVRNNPLNLTDPTGKDLWEKGCGKDSSTCNRDYVGTWDKDHKQFTPTTIQSDKNGNFDGHNVTMTTAGISVDGKYQGVFASGTSATVVNGTGNLSGFQANLSGNCLGRCEAVGTLSALPGHSFSQLLPTLRGPNEKLDRFSGHEGDQYRGGNKDGPDMHVSYLSNRDSQSMHFDWAFPFGSVGGFAQHSADFVAIGIDKMLGQKNDPSYEEVGP